VRKNKGFSLLEKILVLVIAIGVAVGVYKIFRPSDVQAAVHREQQNVGRLVDGIMGAYSTASDFSTLSTQTAAGVLNLSLQQNNTINSGMKTDLSIRPATSTTANDSFDITYAALSSEQCVKLIPALTDRSSAVFVGSSGTSLQNARGDLTNENLLAAQCNSAPTTSVTFRFRGEKHTFSANQLESCMCAPQTENQTLACPSGTTGSIIQRRTGTCTGGTPSCPSLQWSSWTTTSNTCGANAQPVAPGVPVPPANVCIPQSRTQTAACPSGQVGQILQQQTFSCSTNTWSAWSNVSSSCQPNTTPKSCTPSTRRQTVSCPNNQWGGVNQEQSSTCDANGNELWNGDWKTISTTCTATCVGQGTCCRIIRDTDQVRTEFCPTGQYGRLTSTWGRTSTCRDSTSATGAEWGNWIRKTATTGECAACTPKDELEERKVPVNVGCPAGQTGANTYVSVQQRTRRGTFNCIQGSNGTQPTNPDSWSEWTAWTQTETRDAVNTCAAPANSCYVMTDWQTGTSDTRDAYWSISYTVKGVPFSCSISMRDGRDPGVCTQQALSLSAWILQANDGETYMTSGSEGGWGGGAGEFWTWDYNVYERRSGAACNYNFAILNETGSGNSEPYGCRGGTREDDRYKEAEKFCNSSPRGTTSAISYCSDSASHTYNGTLQFRCD